MFNGAECLQIPAYDLIAVQKGIPAGYEHIGYFRVGEDVGSHLVHISGCLAAGDSHQPLAEAMPAVHCASVGGKYDVVASVLYNKMLGSIPNFAGGAVVAMTMLIPSIISIILLHRLEKYNIRYNKNLYD